MSRTQGRVDSDVPYHDGHVFVSPLDATEFSSSGTVTTVRTAAGNYHIDLAASSSITLAIPLSKMIYRTGLQDWLQEQFGSGVIANAGSSANGLRVPAFSTYTTGSLTAGNNVSVPVQNSAGFAVQQVVTLDTSGSGVQEFPVITSITDGTHIVVNKIVNAHSTNAPVSGNTFTTPAGVTGPPPFSGISQLTPVTSPRPKGLAFQDIYPWYLVGGATLSANTIGLTKTTAANNATVASGISSLLTAGTNGMPLTVQTNPYLYPIKVTNANFQTTKFSEYYLEWTMTTASGGTASIYGVFIDVYLNYI